MSSLLRTTVRAARPAARAFSTSARRDIAKITIVGNLADTPELIATSTGREILRYAVASNSGSRDNRTTSWFRVTSFEPEGPRRDFLCTLPKGSLVYVEGDASINTYEDAEGKTRSSLNVVQRTCPSAFLSASVLRQNYLRRILTQSFPMCRQHRAPQATPVKRDSRGCVWFCLDRVRRCMKTQGPKDGSWLCWRKSPLYAAAIFQAT